MIKLFNSLIIAQALSLAHLYATPLSAAVFYNLDTTRALQCSLSSKYQNRIMFEGGRIKKVISSEPERICVQMEDLTGQAFIYARDLDPKDTAIAIVTDTGVVQDIQLSFTDRITEVVILKDPAPVEDIKCGEFKKEASKDDVLEKIEKISLGIIPVGYVACSTSNSQWSPKKGLKFEPVMRLEGSDEFLYIYHVTNISKHQETLLECELEFQGSQWVFLESNTLNPKQKILNVISVAKYE